MPRFHATSTGLVQFTESEERARDIEEMEWENGRVERLASEARAKRDDALKASDWVSTKSIETSSSIPQNWASYRQALRDVPQQSGFPEEIIWPVPPA